MIARLAKVLIFIFFLSLTNISFARQYLEFSPLAKKAYDAAIALRMDESRQYLAELKTREPNNITAEYIANTIDVYTVLTDEIKSEYTRLHRKKDGRLDRIAAIQTNSPYKAFLQAEIRLQWSLVKFQFGEEISSFKEASKAYKLLEKNSKSHPNFIGNKKSLGLLHILVGSVPDSYKWTVEFISGMEGDVKEGIKEIESVLKYAERNSFIFEEETLIQYGIVMLQMGNQNDQLWKTLNQRLSPQKSLMACSVLGYIGIKTGHNEEALKILMNRPNGSAYKSFYYLDFLTGLAKLQRLDKDANVYFNRFIQKTKGTNYIKSSYRNIGLSYLLRGKVKEYKAYLKKCKNNGSENLWLDKKAQQEAENIEIPDFTLLKARMLFDGGYYKKALSLLQDFEEEDFTVKKDRVEYTYRLGRVFHGLKNYMEAVRYYKQTINNGKNEPYYFACRSALEAGLIFEDLKDYKSAQAFYKKCLNISPDEYKTGLHQKAKAGLARVR